MSSNTLSAVLEKQIRRLCLNDFPCGSGSWKKARHTEGAGAEESDTLLDLLRCPHSPWWHDESWSPQAAALRQLAVLTPKRLHTNFIYNYFKTLRIVDKGVSVIDIGLLKFSKLEELVLSVNKISEVPVENLPTTLKILELRANQLSSLNSLTSRPPPHLQYLSLGSNSLGSHDDAAHLTGRLWPQLVCLDLSDCEFQDQQALLNALSTLPCLRTLVLEGNPFTLASCYPGLTVDSLQQLSFLDSSWISPEERLRFRGLAKMSGLRVDQATALVSVGKMRGIPDPLKSVDDNSPDFPVATYRFFITYEFLSHQTAVDLKGDSEPKCDRVVTAENSFSDADLQSHKNSERQTPKPHTGVWLVNTEETCHNKAQVSRHSTSKLVWSECMDFSDKQIYSVCDLGGLKKFLNQGLCLSIEEEKILSWPAAVEDILVAIPNRNVKDNKGGKEKDSSIKSDSNKAKSKDKKKKSAPELVQDAPIIRTVGSTHVPLHSLVKGTQKVHIVCDFGFLQSEMEATQTPEKNLEKKVKDDKKKDKESKPRGDSGRGQKRSPSLKGKRKKEHEVDAQTNNSASIQLEPVTVELSVELEKRHQIF